jgi:hypothetical protein
VRYQAALRPDDMTGLSQWVAQVMIISVGRLLLFLPQAVFLYFPSASLLSRLTDRPDLNRF